MIPPEDFLRVVIDPGCRILHEVTGQDMGSQEAKVLLLAIALQESGLEYRRQIDSAGNPIETLARGWWQFESGGGVKGVMTHPSSDDYAKAICTKFYVPFDQSDLHEALAWNGYLALAWARLLLWTDAAPLPSVGDKEAAFGYYLRNWRPKGWENPSQEKIDRWAKYYPMAVATVAAAAAAPAALPFISPKPGTLTSKAAGGVVQVDLPEMNRSWRTGSFWLSAGSGLLYALILLGPILEPQLEKLGSSAWLAALPLGLGPIAYAVAREWYKGQRVRYAAQVAAAQAKPA